VRELIGGHVGGMGRAAAGWHLPGRPLGREAINSLLIERLVVGCRG
jgi:hypothetical protein